MTAAPQFRKYTPCAHRTALTHRRPTLVRDRSTYTLYLISVTWGFILYGLSAAVPQLAVDLGVSKAVAGLHGSMTACGSIVAGFVLAPTVARIGRRRAMAVAFVVGAIACLGLTLGRSAGLTLPAVIAMATAFTLASSVSLAALTAQQGTMAPAALSEAVSFGAGIGCLAPLAVAASAAVGLGWRGAVGLGVPLAFTVAWMMLRLPPSAWLDGGRWASGFRPRGAPTIGRITARGGRASTEAEAATDDPDPRGGAVVDDPRGGAVVDGPASGEVPFRSRGVFAVFVGVTALASMVELSAVFWGAQLLVDVAGATPGTAAAALTAFIAGITAGRVATARLAVRRSALGLLIVGVGLVAAGWALLWLGTSLTVGVIGLFTMGCGVGPGYPLGTHLSLRHSPRGLDSSQAMVLLATGTGGSLAPFALGWLADRVGVHTAYTVVPSLLAVQFTAIAVGAVILARRRRTLREP